MPDIGIIWDPVNATGDWARPDQEALAAGGDANQDLVAAVLVSLFTDRRASGDFTPTDGTGNRRGCWTDSYDTELMGSRLWQLERARRSNETLLRARDYVREALAWLVRDGVAHTVDVATFWAGRVALGIRVAVTLAAGPLVTIETQLPFQPGAR